MKKRPAAKREPNQNDDTVVYRAGAALLITCAVLFALQVIDRKYPLTTSFVAVRAALAWAAGIFALLAVAGLVGLLGLRKRSRFWKAVSLPALLLGITLSAGCLLLYNTWYEHIPFLFFACIAVSVLYLIKLLYQPEFFLFSVVNISAGWIFYRLSKLDVIGTVNGRTLKRRLILTAIILVCAFIARLASKRDGKISLFGHEWRAISRGGTPAFIYFSGVVWLVCMLAGVFAGPMLAYCCVYIAVVFELAGAVYYTIKLA